MQARIIKKFTKKGYLNLYLYCCQILKETFFGKVWVNVRYVNNEIQYSYFSKLWCDSNSKAHETLEMIAMGRKLGSKYRIHDEIELYEINDNRLIKL